MKSLLTILIAMTLMTTTQANSLPVYFGTSKGRDNGSKGIYAATLDTENGRFPDAPLLVAELNSPGFQVLHPVLPILYSVGSNPETNESEVYGFSYTNGGQPALSRINQQPVNAGKSTHIDVDCKGRMLVTVQYGAGTVSVFPLAEDGSILPSTQTLKHDFASKAHADRQENPHPHNVTFDPAGNYALVPDLGADLVYIYKADHSANKLILHDKAKTAPAAGPRHMKFSKDGKFAYVLNEMSLTVDTFKWDGESGQLSHLATVAGLPEKVRTPDVTNTASEIRIHPNQKFLYTANRGHNSISVFKVDSRSGIPELLEVVPAQVDWPRNFALGPAGDWLICAGQFSNDVAVFKVNTRSGKIEFQKGSRQQVPGPICVLPVGDRTGNGPAE